MKFFILLSPNCWLSYGALRGCSCVPAGSRSMQYPHLIYRESGMFAPGKGFLEIGAGGGDGESFIRLTELEFEAVSVCPCCLFVCFVSCWIVGCGEEIRSDDEDDDLVLKAGLFWKNKINRRKRGYCCCAAVERERDLSKEDHRVLDKRCPHLPVPLLNLFCQSWRTMFSSWVRVAWRPFVSLCRTLRRPRPAARGKSLHARGLSFPSPGRGLGVV